MASTAPSGAGGDKAAASSGGGGGGGAAMMPLGTSGGSVVLCGLFSWTPCV